MYTKERYMHERRRVQSLVYKLRKRGYDIDAKSVLREIPLHSYKSATQRLEQFKTQLSIAEKYLDTDTIRPPAPIQRPDNLPQWYDIEYINFLDTIDTLDPRISNYIKRYLNQAAQTVGKEALMESIKYLEYQEGLKVTYRFNWDPAQGQRLMWEITRHIRGMTPEQREKMWDEYETLIGEYQDDLGYYDEDM